MLSIRNAVLHIDTVALSENVARLVASLGGAAVIPVLKADAYGLGLIPAARALQGAPGVRCFAVAQVYEGLTLRENGIGTDVLVLGATLPEQVKAAVESNLTLSIHRVSDVERIAAAARSAKVRARVQIKFDTGLHRIGIEPTNFYALTDALAANRSALTIEGAYSHFADTDDIARCAAQFALFRSLCDRLETAGFPVPLRHIADSAASEQYPAYTLDAVRIGRRLAWDAPTGPQFGIREVATLTARVLDVQPRRAGDRLGYGAGVTLDHDAVIAVLGIGYGDGLDERMAKQRLPVLLHGKRCPMLFSFMDQTLVEVDDSVAPGDTATLFGYDESGAFLSAQAQAAACGANEGCALTTALLPRVERIYS